LQILIKLPLFIIEFGNNHTIEENLSDKRTFFTRDAVTTRPT